LDLSAFLKEQERMGILIVFSGPSGVGKDTLLRRLPEVCPNLQQCVTYTTREPRPGEVAGIDYNFVCVQDFRKMIEEGEFLEYAQVHLDLYGTPLAPVVEARKQGLDVILKIDVQGGITVKQKVPDALMIFVAPPSMEELERRLRARYTDSEESIEKRLQNARAEIESIPMYDYLVLNDEVGAAVDRLRCIITAERARIRAA
jgi:guanylate kinase